MSLEQIVQKYAWTMAWWEDLGMDHRAGGPWCVKWAVRRAGIVREESSPLRGHSPKNGQSVEWAVRGMDFPRSGQSTNSP